MPSIDLADPQPGRHPIVVYCGMAPPTDGHARIFYGESRSPESLLAAFNYAWMYGPAYLSIAAGQVVSEPFNSMLGRVAQGCGAGFAAPDAGSLPSWAWAAVKRASTDALDPKKGVFLHGSAAPAGCIGTHPAVWAGRVSLIVGHQQSSDTYPNWPFVSLNRQGCSAWLVHQVPDEELTCWTNACGANADICQLNPVLAHYPWRQVIALGLPAARACEKIFDSVVRVHHPMYWSRHMRHRPYQLTKLLSLSRGVKP